MMACLIFCPSFLDFFVFEKINGFTVMGFVRLNF